MTQQFVAALEIAQKKLRFMKLLFFPGIKVDEEPLRRNEFWELIKTLCGALTLISLGIAILSFYLQRNELATKPTRGMRLSTIVRSANSLRLAQLLAAKYSR